MICLHGYDNPEFCKQCPQDAVKVRRRLDALLRNALPHGAAVLAACTSLIDMLERAIQDKLVAELDVLHTRIRRYEDEIITMGEHDRPAIMAKRTHIARAAPPNG